MSRVYGLNAVCRFCSLRAGGLAWVPCLGAETVPVMWCACALQVGWEGQAEPFGIGWTWTARRALLRSR